MIYEILNDVGEVINTIVAEEWFVEQNYSGRYRLVGPEPQPYIPLIITKAAFRFRFADVEYAAILEAADTDYAVKAWVETFNMVSQVNLSDERTVAGLNVLVSKGLLTQERATEILSTTVLEGERP
jgi:hypothetical protein